MQQLPVKLNRCELNRCAPAPVCQKETPCALLTDMSTPVRTGISGPKRTPDEDIQRYTMNPDTHGFIVLKDGIACTSEANRGRYVFYLCLACNDMLPSCPAECVSCACGNIHIDIDMHKLYIGDYRKIQVISKNHNLFVPGRNKNEPIAINNALNEICNGFVSDFESKTGFPVEHAAHLLDRISTAYDEVKSSGKQTKVRLNQNEVFVIKGALKIALDGIGHFEFQTRMGADMKYVTHLHKKYRMIAEGMG